ncbi:hypothetical protein BUALT_Bualt05G0139700 [Buddleja alternifolia]|uniref:Uncharacterized protein n=1 Tax=Buddleja alternifolia TaxID=168488 RepID=A0AAV6XKL9_9LAMI|nr:hypothetical protein BUALT_Bualt05G0139700 [Buddleja alternifolia]
MGTQPNLVTAPDLIKEILNNKEGIFPKIKLKGLLKKIFGDGIAVAESEWFKLRKLANHSFHGDCLKDMVPAMIASVETMLQKWRYHEGKEIEVCDGFKILTSEVIWRTAFGSSYLEGREIFALLTKLHALIFRKTFNIKFFDLLPPILVSNSAEKRNPKNQKFQSSKKKMSSSSIGQVECECEGHKQAKLCTSWTNDNPGRRFHACRNYKVRMSSFCHSIWLEMLNFVVTGQECYEVEVCKLKERAQKLQKKLVLTWVLMFVFIVGWISASGHEKESDSGYVKLMML